MAEETPHEVARALVAYGLTLHNAGQLLQAREFYDEALLRDPASFAALHMRGVIAAQLRTPAEAVGFLTRARALQSTDASVHMHLGIAYKDLQQYDQAIAAFDEALVLQPRNASIWNNRGNALQEAGRLDEALHSYDRALAERPDHAETHWNRSVLHLLRGDLVRGWTEYEWRWERAEAGVARREFSMPRWDGVSSLEGMTVLAHAEQGLGDTLQFCRYVPLLRGRGARVILEVQPTLVPLLRSLAGVDLVVAAGDRLPPADVHIPLMSLPLAFGTTLDTIPWPGPYVQADTSRAARWRDLLATPHRVRVGLVWSGNPSHRNDHRRSVAFTALRAALPAGPQYLCLQPELRGPDRDAVLASTDVTCVGDQFHDFADTAALVAHLDLVITVDTSVVHLAGAMGVPTWLLTPFAPDWRWGMAGGSTPWYPSVRLYRQPTAGDWSSAFDAIARDLQLLMNDIAP